MDQFNLKISWWRKVFILLFSLALAISLPVWADDENPTDENPTDENNVGSQTLVQVPSNLANSPKLNFPDEILADFRAGEIKTRVIINLRDPEPAPTSAIRPNFSNLEVREGVTQQIEATQNDVIDSLDPNEVRITNRFTYIFGFSAEVTVEGLASLVNHPDVESIDEDRIIEAHLAQGIPLMNAMDPTITYNGTGMAIAICDTGIDYNHSKLGNGSFPNSKVIGGYDTGQDDNDPMDEHGHGTSCAGIAAGDTGTVGDYIGGVAYNAKIYALKMSRADIGHSAYTADMVEAWEWCITHQNDDPNNPIMIISTSFGGGYYSSQASCDAYSTAMTTAAANAKAAGITLFVSTGNDGYTNGAGWPGCLSDVIGVGAVYDANIGARYWSVCTDLTTAADQVTCYSNSASFMSMFASSNDAYTTAMGGGYTSSFGGTSAACPYAAGSGAALQSASRAINGYYLTPDQVQSFLETNGDLITDSKVAITKPRVNLGNTVAGVSDELVSDFGGNGLWQYDMSWTRMTTWNADDGLAGWSGGLGVDFGANGVWNNDGSSWNRLATWNAGSAGLAGWSQGLAADFNTSGLWTFNDSSWSKLTNWNPEDDLAGWGNGLAVDFGGNGLWNYSGSSWSRLTPWNAGGAGLAGWSGGLAVDFDTNGLWNINGVSWTKLTNWNPEDDLTGWPGGLAVDFGASGLWSYDGSSWSRLSVWDAQGMAGVADGLVADFGTNGVWKYDGSSWSKLTNWNAENTSNCSLN